MGHAWKASCHSVSDLSEHHVFFTGSWPCTEHGEAINSATAFRGHPEGAVGRHQDYLWICRHGKTTVAQIYTEMGNQSCSDNQSCSIWSGLKDASDIWQERQWPVFLPWGARLHKSQQAPAAKQEGALVTFWGPEGRDASPPYPGAFKSPEFRNSP